MMELSFSSRFDWIFKTALVEKLLQEIGFRAEVVDYICRASNRVAQSDDSANFLEFCASWQERVRQNPAASYPPHWQALAAVSAFPLAIEKHHERDIPWQITRATLLDFQRRFDESLAREGRWEFGSLGWMRNHAGGSFFEIGRLQYISGAFGYAFRVYRDLKSDAVIPLALHGLRCTPDGWPCDDANGFVTSLEECEDGIFGHPAAVNGSIAPEPVTLAPGSPRLLDEDSAVVYVHIPWGEKLERAACVASLQSAQLFYEKYFPELPVRAFCTATWLLDPELGRVLPSRSNIVSFGRLFRPLAQRNATDRQIMERVFGRKASWENCAAQNSLQKAVLQHHRNGGQFRSTAGFILVKEIEALAAPPENSTRE
jgi:hypothetical protein